MEGENPNIVYMDEEIGFRRYLMVLRTTWWKILILSLATGIVAFSVAMLMKNLYEATGTVVPPTEEGKPNISMGLGALASSFGLSVGVSTKIEDLEALFKSRELTVRVFRKYDLWPVISPDAYDPKTGRFRTGWRERIFGKKGETKTPSDWDAVRAAKGMMDVSVNRKLGTLSISFESCSPEGSSRIVSYYLEEAKSRLQEKSLERATRNKKFLEEQIGKTVDPIIRERLYTLYSQEVEREMLARNREQFGFTVLDIPMTPDRKSRPHRLRITAAAMLLSFPAWCLFFGFREKRQTSREEIPGGT